MGNVCENPYHMSHMIINHIINLYDILLDLYIDHMSIHLVKYYDVLNTVL